LQDTEFLLDFFVVLEVIWFTWKGTSN